MRSTAVLLSLVCSASLSFGQHVETTILLPDSVSALAAVGSLVFHLPTNTMYLGGSDNSIVAVDGRTNSKLRRIDAGTGPHLLCSDPTGNKVYCANDDATMTMIDAATNQPIRTFSVGQRVTDLVYNEQLNKLYCGNGGDSIVRVIDCVADSIVARIPVSFGPGALCYNPRLNRIYCVHRGRDEVTVIDCAADTVVSTAWVRGVEPVDICYDSATNCVYTANRASGSVSVFDCAGDTLLRLEAVGREPYAIITGPPGKAYCANYGDSSVSVITDSGVKTVRTRRYPRSLSYDSVNNKVYCSGIGSGQNTSSVTVVDASVDTVTAQLAVAGPTAVCWNPIGNSTYATSPGQDYVSVIGGVSDTVEAVIAFVVCSPGPLCYNSVNNHLYCLDQNNDLLFIIDGDSNRVLKTLKTPATGGSDTLVWNPVSNKVYFTNSYDGTVSIVDCMGDSMVATVEMGGRSYALCSSDDGKVYVANISSCVAVIDGLGDSVRAVVPTGGEPRALCYDRIDNKVYVGGTGERVVHVIDVAADSLVATISIPWMFETGICWNPNHDKAYVSGSYCDTLVVIDCAGDTMLRKFDVYTNLYGLHSDSVCDKVYGFDSERGYLRVFSAAADTAICNLSIGSGSAILDNGKQGPANRLYCATTTAPKSQRSAGTRWTASSVASAWEASRQPSLGTRSTRASTCRIEAVRASV